jgi:predicted small lipoprotein YifL
VRLFRSLALGIAAITLTGCGGGGPVQAAPPPSAVWTEFRHLHGVVDLAGPRSDGSFLVAAFGRLVLLRDGALTPFARGAGGYQTSSGTEPYLVITSSVPVRGEHCSFGKDAAFAISPGAHPSVVMITPQGQARRFASLPPGGFLSGIAFDATGRFGHRLLVTAGFGTRTTVFGIGCDGRPAAVAAGAPAVEGGIVVAPATFGRFGGDLIAQNEKNGLVYAVTPAGKVVVLARSGLPAGGDIGVESAGFVPPRVAAAYLADRLTPGNKHPGDDVILRLSAAALARAGIRAGDLLVATEGGAMTIDVRCAATCIVRFFAAGPAVAHAEGHIVFASS